MMAAEIIDEKVKSETKFISGNENKYNFYNGTAGVRICKAYWPQAMAQIKEAGISEVAYLDCGNHVMITNSPDLDNLFEIFAAAKQASTTGGATSRCQILPLVPVIADKIEEGRYWHQVVIDSGFRKKYRVLSIGASMKGDYGLRYRLLLFKQGYSAESRQVLATHDIIRSVIKAEEFGTMAEVVEAVKSDPSFCRYGTTSEMRAAHRRFRHFVKAENRKAIGGALKAGAPAVPLPKEILSRRIATRQKSLGQAAG